MRYFVPLCVFALLIKGSVWANPIVPPPPLGGYIESEKLVVTISSTDATFAASFTFRGDEDTSKRRSNGHQAVGIDLPIWFPERSEGDASVEAFWKTFAKGRTYDLSTNAVARKLFHDTIALVILTVGADTDPAPDLFKSLVVTSPDSSRQYRVSFQEPGFCCLVLPFSVSPDVIWTTPVNISYRQPLAISNGEGRLFYLPVFKNLPKGISTSDTNRYAITIEATPDCSLTVSSGSRNTTVQSGQSVTLFPKHLQPIRAVSKPMPANRIRAQHRPVVVGTLPPEDIEEIQRVVQHALREQIVPSSEYADDPQFYKRKVKEYEVQRILWIGLQSDGHVEVFAGVSKKAIASEGYNLSLWKDPKWRVTGLSAWGDPQVRPQLPGGLAQP
jgi:hypothetical protein